MWQQFGTASHDLLGRGDGSRAVEVDVARESLQIGEASHLRVVATVHSCLVLPIYVEHRRSVTFKFSSHIHLEPMNLLNCAVWQVSYVTRSTARISVFHDQV